MNKIRIIFKILTCLIVFTSIASAKILVVVEKNYYNDNSAGIQGKDKVDRYINDVRDIDKENVELLVYQNISGTNIQKVNDLWHKMCEKYNTASLADKLTGAVLIGNLPVPVYREPDHGKWDPILGDYTNKKWWHVAFDYPLMNLFNEATNNSYTSDADIRTVYNYDNINKCFDQIDAIDGTSISNKEDIWVSRIFSENLEGLRDKNANWGNFLEPNEIISRYLDKVHKRMILPAETPSRAMAMGGIENSEITAVGKLKYVLCFDNLFLNNTKYIANYDPSGGEKINCPMNWQSQLQAGPFGNINEGATFGKKLGNISDQKYYGSDKDTYGFEWAGQLVHGNPHITAFRGSHNGDGLNGNHFSCNNGPLPTTNNYGGYNKKPFMLALLENKGDFSYVNQSGGYNGSYPALSQMGRWMIDNIPKGSHSIYLYLNQDMLPYGYKYTDQVWMNVYQFSSRQAFLDNEKTDSFRKKIHAGYITDFNHKSETSSDGWVKVYDCNFEFSPSFLQFQIHPFWAQANNGAKKAFALSALKIVNHATKSVRIYDMSNPHNFYTENDPRTRTFYDMQDDGGQSKANFFLVNSCHYNQFLHPNNRGNAYGLGHAGLISFGTTTNNTDGTKYDNFIDKIIDKESFGKAMLSQVNNDRDKVYSLIGTGTLKAQAYVPFQDPQKTTLDLEPYIGKGQDIGVGSDGSVFLVSYSSTFLKKWKGMNWGDKLNSPGYKNIKSVAVDNNGKPWIVLSDNQIYKRSSNIWELVDIPGHHIDINKAGRIVIVNEDRKSLSLSYPPEDNLWSYIYFDIDGSEMVTKAALGNDGTIWVITDNDRIFRYVSTYWEPVEFDEDKHFTDICVDNNGVVTVSTNTNSLYTLTGLGWIKKRLYAGYANHMATDDEGNYWLSYQDQIFKENNIPNMVDDGDFSSYGVFDWKIQKDLSASAYEYNSTGLSYAKDEKIMAKNTAYGVNVTDGGNYLRSVTLAHKNNLTIEKGHKYKVSFWARMDYPQSGNNKILAKVNLNKAPWTKYGAKAFYLTENYRRYEFEFTMNYNTNAQAILNFYIGKYNRSVYFDNVRLEDITK